MIMRDFITASERIAIASPTLIDFEGYECSGCGETSEEIAKNEGWTDDDFDNNSRTTIEGNWYCHIDCFRDSR